MVLNYLSMQIPKHLEHPIVILIRGPYGSGKSYLAAALQQAIGADNVVMLDPDAIDFKSQAYQDHVAACRAEGVDEKQIPYRFSRAQAYAGIEAHKIIIWNQPFSNLEMFGRITDRFKEHAAESGTTVPLLVVEVDIDYATAKKRVEERKARGGHGPSENTFTRLTREYTTAAGSGYTVVSVHGEDEVSQSVAKVLERLSELLH
jgi:predicted ABC-type ATPase